MNSRTCGIIRWYMVITWYLHGNYMQITWESIVSACFSAAQCLGSGICVRNTRSVNSNGSIRRSRFPSDLVQGNTLCQFHIAVAAMENDHWNSKLCHKQWWFPIATQKYVKLIQITRGYKYGTLWKAIFLDFLVNIFWPISNSGSEVYHRGRLLKLYTKYTNHVSSIRDGFWMSLTGFTTLVTLDEQTLLTYSQSA